MNNKDALRDEILLFLLEKYQANCINVGPERELIRRLRADGAETPRFKPGDRVTVKDTVPQADGVIRKFTPHSDCEGGYTLEDERSFWQSQLKLADGEKANDNQCVCGHRKQAHEHAFTIGCHHCQCKKFSVLRPANPPVERPEPPVCPGCTQANGTEGFAEIRHEPPLCEVEPKRPRLPPGWTYEPKKREVNPARDCWIPKWAEQYTAVNEDQIQKSYVDREPPASPRWIVHPPSRETAKGIATIRVYVRNDPKDGHYYVRQEVKQANGYSSDTCIAIFYCSCADANIKAQELCDRLNGVPDERVEYPQDLIKCVQAVAALQNELSVSCRATADHVRKLAQRDAQIEALKNDLGAALVRENNLIAERDRAVSHGQLMEEALSSNSVANNLHAHELLDKIRGLETERDETHAIIAEAKREQMEADCAVLCCHCSVGNFPALPPIQGTSAIPGDPKMAWHHDNKVPCFAHHLRAAFAKGKDKS